MTIHELRDAADARKFLVQSLWLQRAMPPHAAQVPQILRWGLELAGAGEVLPPLGFIADVGQAAFGLDQELERKREHVTLPGWPTGLTRTYEDYVLGKLYADSSFERAADALRRYQGRDRDRGLAFLLAQLRQRAGCGGVMLSPAVFKSLMELPVDEPLMLGWKSLETEGPLPWLPALMQELIREIHNLGEVLGPEDVFELERGTALKQFGQRVALRQTLQAAAQLDALLPAQKVRPLARRHEVATRILDEDLYPVGGYASISTRGSIESLLHSQLAFMEPDERPDLFDVKFLRDELLYYSRDENQFLRRRRSFLFVLHPDLVQARYKDAELPCQRIILALALMLVIERKLTAWLSTDALKFEFLFLQGDKGEQPLAAEKELVEMLFREQIENGTVEIAVLPLAELTPRIQQRTRRSLCHVLSLSSAKQELVIDAAQIALLRLATSRPWLATPEQELGELSAEDAFGAWAMAAERLLAEWV